MTLKWLKLASVALALFVTAPMAEAKRLAGSDDIGARDHREILHQFGGEVQDPRLVSYVTHIGLSLTALTDEHDEAWHFTVLNSPAVNAFALPGGYVYITRGLLALANNEAELASVLGHEIGHVISHHGEDRIRRNNRAGFGVLLGTLLGGVIGGKDGIGDAIELSMKIASGYLAQHSQSEEFAADRIGIRLLAGAGYDPLAGAAFLDQLQAMEDLENRSLGQNSAARRVDFFTSHPATAKRYQQAVTEAEAAGNAGGPKRLNKGPYLAQIDGIAYGDTASDGYIRGRIFSHPDLGFSFMVPEGFVLKNFPDRVVALSASGARMILDQDAGWSGPMSRYIETAWLGQISGSADIGDFRDLKDFRLNGLDAATATLDVYTPQGRKIAQLFAVRFRKATFRIVSLTDREDGLARNRLNAAAQSFHQLTPAEIAGLHPLRLKVVKVASQDSTASLTRRSPDDDYREDLFLVLNGYKRASDMRPGDLVKVVE